MIEEFEYPYTFYNSIENARAVPTGQASKVIIGGYFKITENNYAELMTAVAEIGATAISVDASSWHDYDSCIFNGCNQPKPDINHAVDLIGYWAENGRGVQLICNCSSASYGEAGYIRLYGDDNEFNFSEVREKMTFILQLKFNPLN